MPETTLYTFIFLIGFCDYQFSDCFYEYKVGNSWKIQHLACFFSGKDVPLDNKMLCNREES